MNRRDFCSLPLLLAGCGGDNVEYTLQPSPVKRSYGTSVPVPHYEEGTWIPSIGGNATYNEQIGRFTRIGRICFIYFDIEVATVGTGSTTRIDGLPFVASPVGSGIAGYGSGVHVNFFSNVTPTVVYIAGHITPNNSHILFDVSTAASTTLTASTAVFPGKIVGWGIYEVFDR